jgi:hypothetical protein
MIVFDLQCAQAHVFEAWFGSSADYESQRQRGLIACPMCNDSSVTKAAMAPAVPAKGNSSRPDGMAALLAAQRQLEAQSEYVGSNFATRARALHEAGEACMIYGEASTAEARALHEDGIPALPLPFKPLIRSDA